MKKIKSIFITAFTTLLIPISHVVMAEEIKPQEIKNHPNVYTEDEIIRQPRLLENAIISLIYEQNDNLEEILNLYKKSHSQDPYLILWAEAKVLIKKREYQGAINKLERIVNQYDNPSVKFDLAMLYLLNKKYNQSEKIFNNLLLNVSNEQDKKNINDYIKYIEKKKEINFNMDFSFKRDSNITKISEKKSSGWSAGERIKDVGLSYNPRISKKSFFDSGLFSEFDIDVYGVNYLKEKNFNYLNTKIGNKIGFEDYSNYFYLKPFYMKAFYGGGTSDSLKEKGFRSYYDAIGFDLFNLSSLNEEFKYTIFYENKNEYYNHRKELNGDINFVSSSLIFIPFNDLYMSLSGNYSITNRRDKENSYHNKGGNFLISKRFLDYYLVELNYQKIKTDYIGKNYLPKFKGGYLELIKIKREDVTDSVTLSLSNERINLFGIYPRLSFSYIKNKSNHPYHSYTEKDIFLDFKSNF